MIFSIKWDQEAIKDLKKLDYNVAKKIIKKINNYLIQNPLSIGRPLSHNFHGLYRYRFGDYRIIYEIKDQTIIIIKIGHRKSIYNSNKN